MEKVKKIEADFHDKEEYVIHIKSLKQALNHGLALKKVHRIIKFNQKAWLKTHIAIYWWIMQFLEKPLKILENTEISNL